MEGKYVSDEAYKKGQGFVKKIRTILLIVGLLLLAGGIVLLVFGIKTNNSVSMGDPGWMEARSKGAGMMAGGAFMTFGGVACFLYALVATIVAHQREILAYQASATLPVVGEAAEKGIDFVDRNGPKLGNAIGKTLGGAVGGIAGGARQGWREGAGATLKNVVCPKCQYKNDATDKFCGGCGEKLEQKKHCTNCGAGLKATDKFCASCGTKVE